MIIFYSESCEGCAGNHALQKVKALCENRGIDFEERRTILWDVYEKEANEIMKQNKVDLPFFYGTESGKTLKGFSLTPLDTLESLVDAELDTA